MSLPIVCIQSSKEYELQCKRISRKYSLPLVQDTSEIPARYSLRYHNGVLKLWDLANPKFRAIFVKVWQTHPIAKNSLLGKAVGRKTRSVVDATAGLGGDTLLLARMGFDVTAIERVPTISALLEDGINRAKLADLRLQIQCQHLDAKSVLPNLENRLDTIYLDPMYPPRRKKSVKIARALNVVRELAGDNHDFLELLRIALASTAKRVVVKRPPYADPIRLNELVSSLKGKLVRYDIYIN